MLRVHEVLAYDKLNLTITFNKMLAFSHNFTADNITITYQFADDKVIDQVDAFRKKLLSQYPPPTEFYIKGTVNINGYERALSHTGGIVFIPTTKILTYGNMKILQTTVKSCVITHTQFKLCSVKPSACAHICFPISSKERAKSPTDF